MFARLITLMLIAVLALPVATLTRPAETSHSPWGEIAVAAKGKKHHKKAKPPQPTTVTRTVRQPVTQTFTSAGPLTIPVVPNADNAPANPYPATISVSGFTNGTITDVNLIFDDLTHAYASDLDILLSTSDGRRAMVLSDVGSGPATDLDLILDDEAAAALPATTLTSGTFRPTEGGNDKDPYVAPAPTPDGSVALSTFDGVDPNETWQLWVVDDGSGDDGDLASWALQITAETDVQVEEQVPAATKDKKHKKKGKGRR